MLADLKTWETETIGRDPRTVVIATGAADVNRQMGLRSLILLDDSFRVARSFGASGTPSAVLVDVDGKVASAVAVGADAILRLGRNAPQSRARWTPLRMTKIENPAFFNLQSPRDPVGRHHHEG